MEPPCDSKYFHDLDKIAAQSPRVKLISRSIMSYAMPGFVVVNGPVNSSHSVVDFMGNQALPLLSRKLTGVSLIAVCHATSGSHLFF